MQDWRLKSAPGSQTVVWLCEHLPIWLIRPAIYWTAVCTAVDIERCATRTNAGAALEALATNIDLADEECGDLVARIRALPLPPDR